MLVVLSQWMMAAGYFPATQKGLRHYLDLSVSGGALVPVTKGEGLTNQIGADGQVAFSYEMGIRSFFFNLGVGAQYNLLRRQIGEFVDATPSQDPNMNPVTYRYVFNDFAEQEQALMFTVPLQIGYYFTNHVYMAVGAKLQLPFYGSYTTTTKLYTEGDYVNLMEYISRNVPSFGYYAEDQYKSSGSIARNLGSEIRVAPGIEIGARFHIKKRWNCKVAFYAEYSLPVVTADVQYDLVDYSAISAEPGMRTQDNLRENIKFYPIALSRYNASVLEVAGQNVLAKAAQNMAIGVRFAVHLDVSKAPKICNCIKD